MSESQTPKKEKTKPGIPAPASSPSPSGSARGGNIGAKVGCHAVGCRDKDVRSNFCEEHFRQFKFGLIKKTGQLVSDYERKVEHYQHWIRAQAGKKSA